YFRIEPLGLEYVAAALEARGHAVRLLDLRFSPPLETVLSEWRPQLCGVASAHTLDTNEALAVARRIKAADPTIFTLVGGHAAAVYPSPFFEGAVDAVCCEDGEQVAAELCDALERGRPLMEIRGLRLRVGDQFVATPTSVERVSLDLAPLPARHLVRNIQKNYLCLNKKPVYLVETARGCPFRCSFCTIWQHVDRSFRCRNIGYVCQDLASVGKNVFIADDLFWHPKARSLELAKEIHRRGIRKDWVLVQTRTDLVARSADLLAAWRPFAKEFDIFFGFEAPTDAGLDGLTKDSSTKDIEAAVEVCERLGYGVTGNFIIDPAWGEDDFRKLWEFKERLGLYRAGYTILTPLPGTTHFEQMKNRIQEWDWSKYDMHHLLWEPRLGRQRFFELFAESWKRTVVHAKGVKPWWSWLLDVRPYQIPYMIGVLYRTQRLMDPRAYLKEAFS